MAALLLPTCWCSKQWLLDGTSPNTLYKMSKRLMGRGPTVASRKSAVDGKKTAMYAKLAKELSVVSKAVKGDRNSVRLLTVIAKAKAANMSKDKIDAAIKRGVDGKEGSNAETVLYEGTGPGGSAFMIETLTDNKRRTAPALRHILSKHEGNLGTSGSVGWMFERKGYLEIALDQLVEGQAPIEEDALMEVALELGADDVEVQDQTAQIFCEPVDLAGVRDGFVKAGLEPFIAELIYSPKDLLQLSEEHKQVFDKLVDQLDDNEDVNQIYHNVE